MKLKIFEVNMSTATAIEEVVNDWLDGKEFAHLQIAHITDHVAPRIGVRVIIVYEEALQPALDED